MEMYNDNKLVLRTWLEEGMPNVWECDVDIVTFLRLETNSVLMNLQVTYSFLANDIWTDYQVLEEFLLAFYCDEIFQRIILLWLILFAWIVLLLCFDLLDEVFDLFESVVEMILSASC